jgi:bile acid:Na+ symporter, BASS family
MSETLLSLLNRTLERWIIILLPILLWLGYTMEETLRDYISYVPYLFMFLTFVSSMNVTKDQFMEVWRRPLPMITLLLMFHIVLPVLTFKLLTMFYEGSGEFQLGILLAMIMPIGVTSIVWVSLSKGNVGIAISMVTIDALLSPLLIPFTLISLLGESVRMDTIPLIWGVVRLVVIPCLVGIAVGAAIRKLKSRQKIRVVMSLSSKVTLYIIVMLNAAAMASSMGGFTKEIVSLIMAVAGLIVLGYIGSWVTMAWMRLVTSSEIAFTYSGGIRNYTAGMVIAQLYFSPKVAVPIMLAVLVQHPIALFVHTVMKKRTSP